MELENGDEGTSLQTEEGHVSIKMQGFRSSRQSKFKWNASRTGWDKRRKENDKNRRRQFLTNQEARKRETSLSAPGSQIKV